MQSQPWRLGRQVEGVRSRGARCVWLSYVLAACGELLLLLLRRLVLL